MRKLVIILVAILLLANWGWMSAQEKGKYPPPRFPSYVKPPKSINDIMPYARAAVRQTGGRTPLGLVEKGKTVAIVTEVVADDTVMQAIKRAYEERGVKVVILAEHELAGVNREDALKAVAANRWFTSEKGYMEIRPWITQRFADPEVPKKGLRERRPDIYKAMFSHDEEVPESYREIARKLGQRNIGELLAKYLDEHPDVYGIFWRRGGRPNTKKNLKHQGEKMLGNFIFDNHWELMNQASTFPGDVWKLAEERVLESFAWVDQVHVTDPEGTNFTFDVNEQEAGTLGTVARRGSARMQASQKRFATKRPGGIDPRTPGSARALGRLKQASFEGMPEASPTKIVSLKSATEMYEELRKKVFPDLRIGLLHGRLSSDEKELVMARFQRGDIDILIATTVIEVGVDVPNATVMVIEHAERFGLSQLHQLRGRIGRGSNKSYCVLMTGGKITPQGHQRLDAMLRTQDGFAIAELDLELRGPGEFFGTKQAGAPSFRVANLIRDRKLLELARTEAQRVVEEKGIPISKMDRNTMMFHLKTHWQRRYGLVEVG